MRKDVGDEIEDDIAFLFNWEGWTTVLLWFLVITSPITIMFLGVIFWLIDKLFL